MATIYAYVKIYENIDHAHDFMKGKLFMNTIRAFKEHRDEAGELRGDECEGIIAWYQPESVQVSFAGHTIPSADIAAPIPVHSNEVLRKNAFCIYSLNSRGHESVNAETLADLKATLQIHKSCFGLGSHCVVVKNATEFKERVEKAVRSLGYPGSLCLVDYFDEQTFSGNLPKERWGYQKRSFFKHQREYRVLIDTELESPKPMFLEVGDLSDICFITTPDEFNSSIQLKLPDGSAA
ncbi:hypothetical protein [Halomonas sp.]|uniref:hypothetical protein n=1 Tax=Halomonas sp. TaxID=1486246 RepID=UPI00258FCCD6|nr:hypothetical protein [Halomonas sp.]MCJ8286380.1 hypothetical protein [Halomonas sp.]